MGRKIPSKKHRGVKDPLVQQARRLQNLKGKINAPPTDPDEQPIPRSLTQLFAFQNKELAPKKKNNKLKLFKDDVNDSSSGSNPIAKLKKLPGESGRGFSLRINSAMRTLHDPMEQMDYPQDLEEEDAKGARIASLREWRQKKSRARRKKETGEGDEQPKLSRTQKLALKKQAKKEKLEEEATPELRYERVQFGERADAPPALAAPRRAQPSEKPGRRDLLLKSLLVTHAGGAAHAADARAAAQAEQRERARLDAVAAYRDLKKQRRLQERAAAPPRRRAGSAADSRRADASLRCFSD